MTAPNERMIVNVVNPNCCGLDVHKENITACILFNDRKGKEQSFIQEFSTFTDDLLRYRDWLLTHDCPVFAMESTGVYWQIESIIFCKMAGKRRRADRTISDEFDNSKEVEDGSPERRR
jgi:hypothetical protein